MALSKLHSTCAWGANSSTRSGQGVRPGSQPAVRAPHAQPRPRTRPQLRDANLCSSFGLWRARPVVWARASTVYHEVSVPLAPPGSEGADEFEMREPPTRVTATGRIVAIGDLHGDMEKTLASLRLARVIDDGDGDGDGAAPRWVGGDAVVVQLGDVLDRGNVEIGIIKLLIDLDAQAQKEGGGVYMLNGNHESLNVCGDFRYVTPGAFIESAVEFGIPRDTAMRSWDGCIQARAALFLPGGRVARMLSRNPTVLVVNDTAFAHGGLLPTHVQYGIERMNAEVAAWMRRDRVEEGFASPPFLAMGDGKSVMWNRQLSVEKWVNPVDRFRAVSMVSQALAGVGAKRLVVGHTPQMRGANVDCDGMVWRMDVGMSSGVLDAPVSILEILKDASGESVCRVITEGEQLASFDEAALVDV
ncbi:Ser Thr phosphatase [Raphidocelis subcapitata]|uniref:Ser Thr phosphatase n=1 Tax=Raphidocelis subcapitata TaxID=307507 RepID=A0A2V0P0Z3_9CHLO|nr:Ser Thr phosphatase [Raphidocelis subcapitata]|eukprot:GBF92592.1 Ser Thr phosphatase [Raphidocelis subcapitata]